MTIHVHLSCHSTRVTLTAQSGQAGVRSGSHLPSVRGVRHAQLSLSTARLAVNAVWTLLGVLPASEREQLLVPTLPALSRMCRAFPPFIEDCIQLLVQAATIWISA